MGRYDRRQSELPQDRDKLGQKPQAASRQSLNHVAFLPGWKATGSRMAWARVRGLVRHDGIRWPWRGDGIGVPMDDLPRAVLTAENGCHPESEWRDIVSAADLGAESLYLHDVRQLRRRVLRDELEAGGFALSVMGSGLLKCRLDLGPTPDGRAERIGQGDVVPS